MVGLLVRADRYGMAKGLDLSAATESPLLSGI